MDMLLQDNFLIQSSFKIITQKELLLEVTEKCFN
jgi:hypothetical protein